MFKNECGEVGCKHGNMDFVMEKDGKECEFMTAGVLDRSVPSIKDLWTIVVFFITCAGKIR